MKCSKDKKNNKGMTVPELVMAMLMLTAFTGVFVVVTKFTSNSGKNDLKVDFLNLEKDEYLENCSRLENLIN